MPEKKTNLLPALKKGEEELRKVWNSDEKKAAISALCGCTVDENGIRLPYFKTRCSIEMPDCDISPGELKISEKILLLHYLSRPLSFNGPLSPPRNEKSWITFKQLPNAEFYNATYQKRGPNIILSSFSDRPEQLVEAGKKMGGKKGSYGDYSVIVQPLPEIDAMAVFYDGDDELPPAAEILFPAHIHRYLPLEDTAVLAGITAVRLMKAADDGSK